MLWNPFTTQCSSSHWQYCKNRHSNDSLGNFVKSLLLVSILRCFPIHIPCRYFCIYSLFFHPIRILRHCFSFSIFSALVKRDLEIGQDQSQHIEVMQRITNAKDYQRISAAKDKKKHNEVQWSRQWAFWKKIVFFFIKKIFLSQLFELRPQWRNKLCVLFSCFHVACSKLANLLKQKQIFEETKLFYH